MEVENKQLVGVSAGHVLVMMPRPKMTPEEALAHAAYLVSMAEILSDGPVDFDAYLEAVE